MSIDSKVFVRFLSMMLIIGLLQERLSDEARGASSVYILTAQLHTLYDANGCLPN